MDDETMKQNTQGSPLSGFNTGLSGGAKAGYFFLGFFLGLIGVLIAYLVNKGNAEQVKKDAIKFCVIGLVVVVVLSVVFTIASISFAAMATVGTYGMM